MLAEQVAHPAHPGDALVAAVPHQRDVAAGLEDARDLGERHLVVEPVERLRTTTTSTERSLAGISSAVATLALTSGTRSRSTSSIASSGSVAKTAWPGSTSWRVSLPVPAPSSSTTLASPPVSQATASAGYAGRPRSYASATEPNRRARSTVSGVSGGSSLIGVRLQRVSRVATDPAARRPYGDP